MGIGRLNPNDCLRRVSESIVEQCLSAAVVVYALEVVENVSFWRLLRWCHCAVTSCRP